jgi:hypothetical protein
MEIREYSAQCSFLNNHGIPAIQELAAIAQAPSETLTLNFPIYSNTKWDNRLASHHNSISIWDIQHQIYSILAHSVLQ